MACLALDDRADGASTPVPRAGGRRDLAATSYRRTREPPRPAPRRPARRARSSDLRAQVVEAAARVRGDGGRGRPIADARAPAEGRVRRLLDQRGDAARAGAGAPPREVAERLRRRARATTSAASSSGRGRRPRLPQPVPRRTRWYRAAARRLLAAGDGFGAGVAPEPARAHPGRVRVRQPDRPGDRGERPRRGLRRRAGARCSSVAGHDGRARVLRQRRRQPGASSSRARSRPACAASRAARGRLRGRVRRRARPSARGRGLDPADLERARRAAAIDADAGRGSRRRCERFGVRFDPGSRSARCTSRGAVERALEQLARARPRLRERGRDLAAHDRASATTRTGS